MSDGCRLYGVQYDLRKNLTFPFWERMFDYTGDTLTRKTGQESGAAAMDQTPEDRQAAKVRQYDVAAIVAAALARPAQTGPAKVKVNLPDVLNSVTVTFNKNSGSGATNFPASQQAYSITNAGSGQADIRAQAQASAAIVPSVSWDIDSFSQIEVNATIVSFYFGPLVTMADVLSVCSVAMGATVTDLPIFQSKQHQLVLKGQQVSLQATAETDVGSAFNSNDTLPASSGFVKWGDSYSQEVGVSSHVETIPYSIHGLLTIASNTDTATVTVTVKADTPAITGPGSAAIGAVTNEPTPITLTANGSVKTTSGGNTLSATPQTDVPRTGLKLVDVQSNEDDYGLSLVHATVVDMTQYA